MVLSLNSSVHKFVRMCHAPLVFISYAVQGRFKIVMTNGHPEFSKDQRILPGEVQ